MSSHIPQRPTEDPAAAQGNRRLRICLVSSVGGHFRELLQLRPVYGRHEHFYVVNDRMEAPPEIAGRMIRIRHFERDWRQVLNFFEAWTILRRWRPHLVITTGASPAVVFGLAARLLGIPLVFIECSSVVERPSLSGRLVYWLGLWALFLYQWPQLKRVYPRGTYGGLVF